MLCMIWKNGISNRYLVSRGDKNENLQSGITN